MTHPGFWAWWRAQAEGRARSHADRAYWGAAHVGGGPASWGARCSPRGDCGPRGGWHPGSQGFDEAASGFGVRRPLRFLAHKLELDDEQVGKLAGILNTLKTERAQSEVDFRRRTASLADAFEATPFDEAKVDAANADQARSADRLRAAVKLALQQMHALFNEEQRKRFAYLLRAGVLSI